MSPIYQSGSTHQFSKREDGQWFYRLKNQYNHWQRWLACMDKSVHAWYNPQAGKARLPKKEQ